MRRTVLAALSAATVITTAALISAPAEAADVRCHIPFTFEVRGQTMPPGDYTFSAQPQVLFVRGYRHSAFALTLREQSVTDTGAKAVFDREGDTYVLRDVWTGGGVGRELLPRPGRGEHRQSAQGREVEQVTIPAL
jgi:hypothetical protein